LAGHPDKTCKHGQCNALKTQDHKDETQHLVAEPDRVLFTIDIDSLLKRSWKPLRTWVNNTRPQINRSIWEQARLTEPGLRDIQLYFQVAPQTTDEPESACLPTSTTASEQDMEPIQPPTEAAPTLLPMRLLHQLDIRTWLSAGLSLAERL
jgi:hypothetical protein